MNSNLALKMATELYYWKPMAAFFRSIEMEYYYTSCIFCNAPTLDLGCGSGGIAHILKRFGMIKESPHGIDISITELKKAKAATEHLSLLQADANDLPFKDDSFSSIICNGVLCSIPEGAEHAIKEVYRILKRGGVFIGTVPTDKFIQVLVLPKILGKFSSRLSQAYVKKLNRRLPHFNTYPSKEWNRQFASCGLSVVKSKEFFTPKAGMIWNILSMQIFRIFGLLKFIRNQKIIDFICILFINIFTRLYTKEEKLRTDYGYVFMVAKKKL